MQFRFWLTVLTISYLPALSQEEVISTVPKKGSYLYWGQLAFEDNSFLFDEAINQEKGIMQYVSNLYFDNVNGGNLLYSFTQEIPVGGEQHQLNYSLLYHLDRATPSGQRSSGFGDISVGYHYKLTGKRDKVMVIPGITVIIPTGNSQEGRGIGGAGAQATVTFTKRLSHRLVTHYNIGYTFISQADRYTYSNTDSPVLAYERNLHYAGLGAGATWYVSRKKVLFAELISNFVTDINQDGSLRHRNISTINPGFRFCIDANNVQIVPGVSSPIILTDGAFSRMGIFFYLSIESEYLPFTRQKHR